LVNISKWSINVAKNDPIFIVQTLRLYFLCSLLSSICHFNRSFVFESFIWVTEKNIKNKNRKIKNGNTSTGRCGWMSIVFDFILKITGTNKIIIMLTGNYVFSGECFFHTPLFPSEKVCIKDSQAYFEKNNSSLHSSS
jgi:hypothetical protein